MTGVGGGKAAVTGGQTREAMGDDKHLAGDSWDHYRQRHRPASSDYSGR